MSSAPAMLDAPSFSAVDGTTAWRAAPNIVLTKADLLDDAASVWATLKYARTIPTSLEDLRGLQKAEKRFLADAMKLGIGEGDLDRRIRQLGRLDHGEPPGA